MQVDGWCLNCVLVSALENKLRALMRITNSDMRLMLEHVGPKFAF